jgi:hypothetical protein
VEFKTKTELAREMLAGHVAAGTPFGWAAGDEVYGRSRKLREACEDVGKGCVFAVPVSFRIQPCPRRGKIRVDAAAGPVPAAAWETRCAGRAARATGIMSGPGWRRSRHGTGC